LRDAASLFFIHPFQQLLFRFMRRSFFGALFLAVALLAPALPAAAKKVTRIVLDAGHGGVDPGARGQFSSEKDLTMAIVFRVQKMIQDSMRGVEVVLTRSTDFKVPLAERHAIANRAEADLFISVHINSTAGRTERVQSGFTYVGKGKRRRKVPTYRTIHHRETSASGTETLVIGTIRQGEKTEAIGEYGEAIVGEPGLLNPADPQTAIIIAQYSAAFAVASINLAQKIQDQFAAQGRRDGGVKQQSLEVLAGSAMPGVLVECGYINNPQEEAYMNSEVGQREIASAIFRAIRAYKMETDRTP